MTRDLRLKEAILAHEQAMDAFCGNLALLRELNPSIMQPEAAQRALDVVRSLQQISDILDEEPLSSAFKADNADVVTEALGILAITMLMMTVLPGGKTRPFRQVLATQFSNELIRSLKAACKNRAECDA